MTVEQAIAYVDTLNALYCNKVITRSEFRAALKQVPLFGAVCTEGSSPKGKKK